MVFKYTAQTLGCLYISRRKKKKAAFMSQENSFLKGAV